MWICEDWDDYHTVANYVCFVSVRLVCVLLSIASIWCGMWHSLFCSFFELKATLPVDHELKIQLKDYDLISADDLIGETVIDLENRYLTKHRATVGIADEYYMLDHIMSTGTQPVRQTNKHTDCLTVYFKLLSCPRHPIWFISLGTLTSHSW